MTASLRAAASLLLTVGVMAAVHSGGDLARAAVAAPLPTATPAPIPAPHSYVAAYAPGWHTVGGPSGVVFPTPSLYTYSLTRYLAAAPTISDPCQGHWGYFSSPEVVNFPLISYDVPGAITQMRCALQPRWNLVGNPFSAMTTLPAGAEGYLWDGQGYDRVTLVPMGNSVWIFATAATSLVLTPI